MNYTNLHFSRVEEEGGQNEMESTSIFVQFPVTLGDNEEADEVTVEGESQVSRATDQTAAGQEEDCLQIDNIYEPWISSQDITCELLIWNVISIIMTMTLL